MLHSRRRLSSLAALLTAAALAGVFLVAGTATAGSPEIAFRSTLQHFGYYGARVSAADGNHLPDVAGHSDLNWVNISDRDRYAPEALDACTPDSCVVYTGNEFFANCDVPASPHCSLYPDYLARWQRLADVVRPKLSKVAAFYVLDEPYWRGATPEMVSTAAGAIKTAFPDRPVIMVEAAPKVTSTFQPPQNVDWIGFDWYCQPIATVETRLKVLESRTPARQRLILLPQSAPLKMCGSTPGYQADADLAKLQWDYMNLADRHPRVIGLMTFGFWVDGASPSSLPATSDADRQIANQIFSRTHR